MPSAAEFSSATLYWAEGSAMPDLSPLRITNAVSYASFDEALERARTPPTPSGHRPWIAVGGVLFGPDHIKVLNAMRGRRGMASR